GVVDVAVDVVGAVRLGVEAAADGVRGPAQGGEVAAAEQGQPLVRRQALAADRPVQDPPHASVHLCLSAWWLLRGSARDGSRRAIEPQLDAGRGEAQLAGEAVVVLQPGAL